MLHFRNAGACVPGQLDDVLHSAVGHRLKELVPCLAQVYHILAVGIVSLLLDLEHVLETFAAEENTIFRQTVNKFLGVPLPSHHLDFAFFDRLLLGLPTISESALGAVFYFLCGAPSEHGFLFEFQL